MKIHTFRTFGRKEKSKSNQTPKFLTASEAISDSHNMFTGQNGLRLEVEVEKELEA